MKTVLVFISLAIHLVCGKKRDFTLTTARVRFENFEPTTSLQRFYGDSKRHIKDYSQISAYLLEGKPKHVERKAEHYVRKNENDEISKKVEKKSGQVEGKPENVERRHRDRASIWNWDSWCQMQPRIGNCRSIIQRYFYDIQLDNCLPFNYSGCGGNKNKFDTVTQCERSCEGVSFTDVKKFDLPTSCSLQPHVGHCFALYDRYYYDVNTRDCKRFKYSGCGGNQNRFHTKYKCREKCSQD